MTSGFSLKEYGQDYVSCQVKPRVLIIGVGLMGGSLGKSLLKANCASQIVGLDGENVLQVALESGAISRKGKSLEDECPNADCIFLCAPIHSTLNLIPQIAKHVSPDCIVTDIGSIKSQICSLAAEHLGSQFIGGHPMAGSELTSITNATWNLYEGASWALVPVCDKQQDSVAFLSKIISYTGAHALEVSTAEVHDAAAALISHLPHVICFAYNYTVEHSNFSELALKMAAGSYRDLTRVITSDPILWRDVFKLNKHQLLDVISQFRSSLQRLETVITEGEDDSIHQAILAFARTT